MTEYTLPGHTNADITANQRREIAGHILYDCDGPLSRFGLIFAAIELGRHTDLDMDLIANELEDILQEWDAGELEGLGQRS